LCCVHAVLIDLNASQDKPIEMLRNGNYDIGTNTYMMFEADPPKQIKSRVIKSKDEVRFKEDLKDYGDAQAGLEMRIGQLEAGIQASGVLRRCGFSYD
jgi:hypothetical protein